MLKSRQKPGRFRIGNLLPIAGRMVETARREGSTSLVFRLLDRLGLYRRWAWFVRSLDEPVEPIETSLSLEIFELRPQDVEEYVTLRRGANATRFLHRLEIGDVCWGGRHAGRLVVVQWVYRDGTPANSSHRGYRLGPGDLYVRSAFTSPELRGQRLQGALGAHVLSVYRARGYRRAVALIVPENRSSIAAMTRLGFRRAGLIGTLRLGPVRRDFRLGRCDVSPAADAGSGHASEVTTR